MVVIKTFMTKWLQIRTIFAKTQKNITMNTLVAVSSIPINSVGY